MESRGIKRLVPWKTSEEWRKIYVNVFSGDIEKKRWACEILQNWNSRYTNDLSMGLKLTLLLTEAQLLDHHNHLQTNPQLTEFQVSTQYAYAITRFVNDLLETMQDKKFTISLSRLAIKAGIPARLVQMRHDCTHGELSSVAELRGGAGEALMFLKKQYWEAQIYHYSGVNKEASVKKKHSKGRVFNTKYNEEEEEDEEDRDAEEEDRDDEEEGCDNDEVLEEKVVNEELFREEYKMYVQEGMHKLLEEYLSSMRELSGKSRPTLNIKVILYSVELFLQADSGQALLCLATNLSFLNSIRNSESVPSDWQRLVALVTECDLVAVLVHKLVVMLGGDDDEEEEEEEDEEKIEKLMWWCIVILRTAKNAVGQSSLFERARDLVVEVISRYNEYSQELLDLLLPYCTPPLNHHNIQALKVFSRNLNSLNKDPLIFDDDNCGVNNDDNVDNDNNDNGEWHSTNKEVEANCSVDTDNKKNINDNRNNRNINNVDKVVNVEGDDEKQGCDDDDEDVKLTTNDDSISIINKYLLNFTDTRDAETNSGCNEIMLLKMDSATIPRGIKTLSFYERLPKIPLLKKRKMNKQGL